MFCASVKIMSYFQTVNKIFPVLTRTHLSGRFSVVIRMDYSDNRLVRALSKLLRLLPLLCMGAAILLFLTRWRSLTVEDFLNYSPSQPLLAMLFLWLAFAVKSLSIMFPVMLLFAVSGRLFPLPVALLVNVVGISITLTLPYLIGRYSGKDLTEKLMVKYPKLAQFRAMRSKSGMFFAFIIRAVGVLPCDVVSLYLGNTRLNYSEYLIGGMLGFMPDLLCATIVGMKISDVSSPWFWGTIGVNITVCVISMLVYRQYMKKHFAK